MIILSSEYEFDFELYGVICPLRESKLAYLIERNFKIEIYKQPDIFIEFLDGAHLEISNYLYEESYANFRLLRNKSWYLDKKPNYIVPEMKQFDYLLLINGDVMDKSDEEFVGDFKRIEPIQLIQRMDVEQLKSKENLIFE